MAKASVALYDLLKDAGIGAEQARQIAQIVLTDDDRDQLATKADLANLKNEILYWISSRRRRCSSR